MKKKRAPRIRALTRVTPQQLEKLARAIARATTRGASAALAHNDVEAFLDFYIDAELRQEPVRSRYPQIWKHLQTCERCRQSYELQLKALRVQTAPTDAKFAWTVPYSSIAKESAAWRVNVHPRVGGAPLGFQVEIFLQRLQQVFAPVPPVVALRGDVPAAQKRLLLSDILELSDQNIAVEIWTDPLEPVNQTGLEIKLAADQPLPPQTRVTLKWQDHQASAIAQNGIAHFTQIPVSELQTEPGLIVQVETVEP